jgi:hypothetical protein
MIGMHKKQQKSIAELPFHRSPANGQSLNHGAKHHGAKKPAAGSLSGAMKECSSFVNWHKRLSLARGAQWFQINSLQLVKR